MTTKGKFIASQNREIIIARMLLAKPRGKFCDTGFMFSPKKESCLTGMARNSERLFAFAHRAGGEAFDEIARTERLKMRDKALPFAESEPGATGVELLLSLALKWAGDSGVGLMRALAVVTCEPARVLGGALVPLQSGAGRLVAGGAADLCVFDPRAEWMVAAGSLRSQGKHTPFSGYELPCRVCCTIVSGRVAFEA